MRAGSLRIMFWRRRCSPSTGAIYQWPDMAEEGGFIGYGPSIIEMYRERARIAVKVLRGAKPADIPVEQPTLFELVINLKMYRDVASAQKDGRSKQ